MGQERLTDKDHRDLLGRLFTFATELAEAAHDAAIRGQSARSTRKQLHHAANCLEERASELLAAAQTARALLSSA